MTDKEGREGQEGQNNEVKPPVFEPAASVEYDKKGGCFKKILVGCGVLVIVAVVVFVVAVALFVKNKDKMANWVVEKVEVEILNQVGDEKLKKDLELNFNELKRFIVEDRLDESDVQNLVETLNEVLIDGSISKEDISKINAVFDDVLDREKSPLREPSEEEPSEESGAIM